MVMSRAIASVIRDEPMGEEGAVSPRELIRRCQGLAEG